MYNKEYLSIERLEQGAKVHADNQAKQRGIKSYSLTLERGYANSAVVRLTVCSNRKFCAASTFELSRLRVLQPSSLDSVLWSQVSKVFDAVCREILNQPLEVAPEKKPMAQAKIEEEFRKSYWDSLNALDGPVPAKTLGLRTGHYRADGYGTAAINSAVLVAKHLPGKRVALVTSTERWARELFRLVVGHADVSEYYSTGATLGDYFHRAEKELTWENGSTINVYSADRVCAGLSGRKLDLVVLDDFGDFADTSYLINHIIKPAIADRGGRLILMSQDSPWDAINAAWDGLETPRQPCSEPKALPAAKAERCEKNPKNNDGRGSCASCAGPLKRIQGFSSSYDYCERCKL